MTWRIPRLRLAPRFAIAIILTVAAAYLLDRALIAAIPPQPFLIVQRAWLIDAVEQATRLANSTRGAQRSQALASLPAGQHLGFRLASAPPGAGDRAQSHLTAELARAIAGATHAKEADVVMTGAAFDQYKVERTVSTVMVIIPDLPAMLTAETLATNESSVLGGFSASVRLKEGSWLTVAPRETSGPLRHYARFAFSWLGNLLIVAFFALWMARSVINPLRRLAAGAERLGRDRELHLISGMRLPEHAAIATTFNAMQLRIKRYIDERMRLLAAISHDLRTPLTRLRLLAEYLPAADQRALLSNISEMEVMVSDSLAFMSGEMRAEPTVIADVAALLISLCDEHKDLGDDVEYDGPDHLNLRCRPAALKRAFANVISNGCKYGESVCVRLYVSDGKLVVDVQDKGPGIPPDQADLAFAPFQRLEGSRSRQTGGTGLGLAIARDIVRGHDGDILLLNRDDGFTVRIILSMMDEGGRVRTR